VAGPAAHPTPASERNPSLARLEHGAGPGITPQRRRACDRRAGLSTLASELAFADGAHSGAGQLDLWVWLDYLHGRRSFGPISGWLVEHQVDLGSSEEPATHALVLDRQTGEAWIAPIAPARAIVRAQDLEAP
jgi:hypothetical protein